MSYNGTRTVHGYQLLQQSHRNNDVTRYNCGERREHFTPQIFLKLWQIRIKTSGLTLKIKYLKLYESNDTHGT